MRRKCYLCGKFCWPWQVWHRTLDGWAFHWKCVRRENKDWSNKRLERQIGKGQ